MSEGQLLVTVSNTNVTLENINDNLRHLDQQFFFMISDMKAEELKKRSADLQSAISQLEADLRKQQQSQGILDTLAKVTKCGEAIGSLVAAIAAEDPAAIAKAIKDGGDAFQSLQVSSQSIPQQLAVLRQELEKVQLEFDELTLFVADKKQEYLAKQYSDLIRFCKRGTPMKKP